MGYECSPTSPSKWTQCNLVGISPYLKTKYVYGCDSGYNQDECPQLLR